MILRIDNHFLQLSDYNVRFSDHSDNVAFVSSKRDTQDPYIFTGEKAEAVKYLFTEILPHLGPYMINVMDVYAKKDELEKARADAEAAQKALTSADRQQEMQVRVKGKVL